MNDLSALQQGMDEDPAAAPSTDALLQLQTMAQRVLTIDAQLAELKTRVEERERARNLILTKQMPDLMIAREVDHVGVTGYRFVLEDFYHASIKKDSPTRDEAYDWLEKNDAGSIINYTLTATFPKDSTEQVTKLATYIRQRYQNAEVTVDRGVPWKRLTSWLKELFERKASGEDLKAPPLDVLGATVGQYVKVVPPKAR